MTAKEKAEELVEKFTIDIGPFSEYGHWDEYQGSKSALLCVDEILNYKTYLIAIPLQDIEYWKEVKKEIEQL